MKHNWLPFEEAREIVRKLGLKSLKEWRKYCKKHKMYRIPVSAEIVYKNHGWISLKHWLGIDNEKGSRLATEIHNIESAYPWLVDGFWDYDKNTKRPTDICPGARDQIYLKCERNHKWSSHAYSLRNLKGCPFCLHKRIIKEESFGYKYPVLLRYWDYDANKIDPYNIYSGSGKKIHLKCEKKHKWQRRLDHIVNRGDNCPYCDRSKIKLQGGVICNSMIEAYYYLLLRQSEIEFKHNCCYPNLKLRYDFYIPYLNLYIETTSYNRSVTWWSDYLSKINKKQDYVQKQLGNSFEFINRQLTNAEMRLVRENSI